jgi:ACT domain-containing protein
MRERVLHSLTLFMDQLRPGLDRVLHCLSCNGYSAFSLIDDILAHNDRENETIKILWEGMERDAADICAHLRQINSGPESFLKFGRVQRTCLRLLSPSVAQNEY